MQIDRVFNKHTFTKSKHGVQPIMGHWDNVGCFAASVLLLSPLFEMCVVRTQILSRGP